MKISEYLVDQSFGPVEYVWQSSVIQRHLGGAMRFCQLCDTQIIPGEGSLSPLTLKPSNHVCRVVLHTSHGLHSSNILVHHKKAITARNEQRYFWRWVSWSFSFTAHRCCRTDKHSVFLGYQRTPRPCVPWTFCARQHSTGPAASPNTAISSTMAQTKANASASPRPSNQMACPLPNSLPCPNSMF